MPTGEDSCLAFALAEKKITVYEGTAKFLREKQEHEVEWKDGESFQVPFDEHFHVFGTAQDYFFVTRSGKVFAALKPEKGKKREVVPVEVDGKRPVTAVITDADAKATFVFTNARDKGGSDERGAYLRLDGKSKPARYDLKGLSADKAEEPMKTVVECTKVLLAEKQIAIKEKNVEERRPKR